MKLDRARRECQVDKQLTILVEWTLDSVPTSLEQQSNGVVAHLEAEAQQEVQDSKSAKTEAAGADLTSMDEDGDDEGEGEYEGMEEEDSDDVCSIDFSAQRAIALTSPDERI